MRRKVTYSLGGSADIQGNVRRARPRLDALLRDRRARCRSAKSRCTFPATTTRVTPSPRSRRVLWLDVPFDQIRAGLESGRVSGAASKSRAKRGGVLVVDDYGHHPTEIAATIRPPLPSYQRRLFVLFQPHRYSRTQGVAAEFGHCFDGAHKVFVTDIYAAGEKPIPGVAAHTIIERVKADSKIAVEHAHLRRRVLDASRSRCARATS